MRPILSCFISILILFTLLANGQTVPPAAVNHIPTPKEHFGFNIGDDYMLANYTQTLAYFQKLAEASDRAKFTVIGKTEEGRDQFMLIVSSPDNLKHLDRYKSISQQL